MTIKKSVRHRNRYFRFNNMSEIESNLRIGCTVFVAASRFDYNRVDRCFVAKFGTKAETEELIWHVVSHRVGRWKVHVLFDDTYYTFNTAALKHTVGSCLQCAPS